MSDSLLSRALEAGFSLEDGNPTTLPELARTDVKAYITGIIADVLNAREEAAKSFSRMVTVESHLDVLLDAAKGQYRGEYDGQLRSLSPIESSSMAGDIETEPAGKYGP